MALLNDNHRTEPRLEPDVRTGPGLDMMRLALIVGAILGITLVYQQVPDQRVLLNKVLQYLYFLPIVVAAFWWGWKGGILAALAAGVFYIPGIPLLGRETPTPPVERYGEAVDLLITGSVLGILANRDRKRALELQKTNARLEETYRKLEQSIGKLRESERFSAVGQLAANLAHELRNPLAGIEGAADLLQFGKLDEPMQVEFLQIIKKESQRLSRLLSDLLDFARPRSFEPIPVPLSELVNSIVGLVAPTAQKSNVRLRAEIDESMPPVPCDPAQMKQVMLNLVMNAIQAMPNGGEVLLRTRRDGSRAILEVRDEGSGVAPEALDQLFIPFYTTRKEGTGLGLPIAQQIVLGHGGTITVDSNQPRGSVFSVVLPLAFSKGRNES